MNRYTFERPTGAVVMRPGWKHLLFLHWEFEPEVVQKLLPEDLKVDCFEGKAYIGLVPFVMENVRPHFVPNLGRWGDWYENFAELNVRTYVTHNGVPGVWFFSLDAASAPAVVTARLWFNLPYFKARMRFRQGRDGALRYWSKRLWPRPTPAICSARYRIEGEAAPAEDGSLEQFLVERYVLYSKQGDQLYSGRVHHRPYQIQKAKLEHLHESCVQAAGFSKPDSAPHTLYARGVDVEIWGLEECTH